MRRALVCVALALAVVTAVTPLRASEGGLPPFACLEAVRSARLAGERGDFATARRGMEAAAALPGCELPALAELLALARRGEVSPAETQALRERLAQRLRDPTSELPVGLLSYLVLFPASASDDELLLAALEHRLAGTPAADAERPSGRGLAIELLEVVTNLQVRLGRSAAARDTLSRLLALAPDDARRWQAVNLDLLLGRWAAAAELLATMVEAPEAPPLLRHQYLVALAHLGRYDELLVQLDRLQPPDLPAVPALGGSTLDLPPSHHVGVLLTVAWTLRDAGRDTEAAATFRRVLAHAPDTVEAQLALLHLYGSEEERSQHAAAVAARFASETDPVALFEQGSDRLGAGDAEGAAELLARAAPALAESDYAEAAWYNLATAALQLERWGQAAEALAAAIATNPGRADSHFKLGVALARLERCREAVPALRRALELAPDKREAHGYLANCYRALGDLDGAARHAALSRSGG